MEVDKDISNRRICPNEHMKDEGCKLRGWARETQQVKWLVNVV